MRGAEIKVGALATRLAAVLPDEIETGDGYALLNATGKVLGSRGDAPAGVEPAVRVPLDAALLPGWQVEGFMPAPDDRLLLNTVSVK